MKLRPKELRRSKKRVALIGPILCNSGIGSVVKAMIDCERLKTGYEILVFNSSNYEDSNSIVNLFIFIKSIALFLKKLLEGNIDLAHIHTSHGASYYRKAIFVFLSSLFRVRIVFHFHSSRFDSFFMDSGGLKKKIIQFTLGKSDAVVVLCHDWKDKIENKFALRNTHIINNPIPFDIERVESHRNKTSSRHLKILFLGFLVKAKGIYDIVEIAKAFDGSSSSPRFLICGKGPEEREFLEKIKDGDLHNIEYLGWVSGKKKIDLYRNCDIFLLPSYYEGMPMVLLEAIGSGLPVIASRVGGVREIVIEGENGYLLKPGDVEKFVDKIRILLSDPVLREAFSFKSRMLAEKFKKERISEEWHQLYQQLVH